VVDRTERLAVPQTHANEIEHRKMLAVRANASMPKDGTEGMAAPFRLKGYATADLPDATLYPGAVVYEDTLDVPAISDGAAWKGLALSAAVTTEIAAAVAAAVAALPAYSAGSWTPVLAFGGSSTGITYTTQVGRYIRHGDRVTAWATITITSNGSGTGAATVSGLPFAASTVTGLVYPGTFKGVTGITATGLATECSIASAASVIDLFIDAAAATDTLITNTASFALMVNYRTG
jgi:hypothetical protein